MPNEVPLNVAAARVALSPKPQKDERRPSTAALIAKIPFLQRSSSFGTDQHREQAERDGQPLSVFPALQHHAQDNDPSVSRRSPVLADVLEAQSRKRKSSLRRNVLQTTGRLRLDARTSRDYNAPRSPTNVSRSSTFPPVNPQKQERASHQQAHQQHTPTKVRGPTTSPTRLKQSFELGRPEKSVFSNDSYPESLVERNIYSQHGSISPTDISLNTSSTDDNDSIIRPSDSISQVGLSRSPTARTLAPSDSISNVGDSTKLGRLPPPALVLPAQHILPSLGSPATIRPPPTKTNYTSSSSPLSSESSFPPPESSPQALLKRRTSNSSLAHAVPLASSAADNLLATISTSAEDTWDYSETEWWGYIILIVTWLVFVVGMGSCFGVWSWAWDVGTTPYAPPEFEDDPTLPIVGYYPSLMVLTGVMSWVWVVVAWVGMKYFKHAKIGGDD